MKNTNFKIKHSCEIISAKISDQFFALSKPHMARENSIDIQSPLLTSLLFTLPLPLILARALSRDVHGRERTCSNLTRKVRTGSNAGNYKNHAPRVRAAVHVDRSKRKQHSSGLWLVDWGKGKQYESGSWLIVVNA